MREFQANQPATEAHRALKSALQTMDQAKQCAVLWFGEILARKLYRELGYSSMNQYAKVELGFSSSRTGDFLSLCRKLENLPKIKAEIETGKLGYTKARVLAAVSDKTNEDSWLKVARENSRRELERQVKQAKRAAAEEASGQTSLLPVAESRPAAVVPVRVTMEMTPGQFARYEALWEQIRKRGGVAGDKVEALLEVMAGFVAETSPRGDVSVVAAQSPVQVHVHQCPDCAKASVQTSKGELELGVAELEQALCDCRVSAEGGRNTSAIPPATRRKVLARDRFRCQREGCGHTRYLEVHHKVPRSRGGTNDEDNLVTLCSGCHGLVHGRGVGEEVVGYWVRGFRGNLVDVCGAGGVKSSG